MRLVYFAPVAWDSYAQRPHYMMEFFLRSGVAQVAWVNPYPTRLPRLRDVRRPGKSRNYKRPTSGGIRVFDVPGLPIEPLPFGAWVNSTLSWSAVLGRLLDFTSKGKFVLGIGRPSGFCKLFLTRRASTTFSFYDAMDDFPEFYSGISKAYARRLETEIVASVDKVWASSSKLVRKFESMGIEAALIRNGYAMSTLPEFGFKPSTCPTIGYIGTMSDWFDWDVVIRLAKEVPTIPIVLVGPTYLRPLRKLPGNIRLLAECSQTEAVRYLESFSVGIIPFRKNRLTEAVDPIKYYEYRAMGLPVLSTAFGEMATRDARDGVFFLDGSNSFASIVFRALAYTPQRSDVMQFRRENTWEVRFSKLEVSTWVSRERQNM